MPEVLEVAHIALEYNAGVGGIKAVTTGLLPALANDGTIRPSIITPFYDVYDQIYQNQNIEHITTVTHIYKGKPFKSDVLRVCNEIVNGIPVYHYLIKPAANSSVAWIFKVGNEKDLYQSFPHSESGNRLEYFNGAAAMFIRTPNAHTPAWDIVHTHTWHTGLAGFLIKEMENLPAYQDLLKENMQGLKKIPYLLATLHMLRKQELGILNSQQAVTAFIDSVGIPNDFLKQYPLVAEHFNENHMKRAVLPLIYADAVTTVSKGLAAEIVNGQGEGLDALFIKIYESKRLLGITNGIDVSQWAATNPANVKEYAFNPQSICEDKLRLKEHLATKYPQLEPHKKWFIYVGRFADEKGVDYLKDLLTSVKKVNGNLIVLGAHVVNIVKDGKKVSKYQAQVDAIRADPDAVVLDDATEQNKHGKFLRAAADCAVSLSKNEACGLIPMELMTCAAISVAPNIQGLPDTVISLAENPESGSGFLYEGALENRAKNLDYAILQAAAFLDKQKAEGTLEKFLQGLLQRSQQYDWSARPVQEYQKLYRQVISRELLTGKQIRTTKATAPLLLHFNTKKKPQNKIWQIGFNKCGSTTMFDFFWKNGVLCTQHGNQGDLAVSIQDNFNKGLPLLSEKYAKYQAFFDIENIYSDPPLYPAQTLFKEMDRQYPGSKFILNTRDKAAWLESRRNHVDPIKGIGYVEYLCKKYGISEDELIARWSKEWDAHHAAVLEYFKDRPSDLLIFNIDIDGPEKIQQFFAGYFDMDTSIYEQKNKGIARSQRAAMR